MVKQEIFGSVRSVKFAVPAAALALALGLACGSTGDNDTTASGQAAYEDAATNADGSSREADAPQGTIAVRMEARGSGTLEGVDATCADSATGMFRGVLEGDGEVGDDGAYTAVFASSDTAFETPSGCDVPSVAVTSFTEVVVRGELSATAPRCQAYCSAKARSHAEAECAASGDQAACRTAAEMSYSGSCAAACTPQEHLIVAETSLSATALATLAAESTTGAALGEVTVNLGFDRLEDSQGNVVSEM